MDEKALKIVRDYIFAHLDKTDIKSFLSIKITLLRCCEIWYTPKTFSSLSPMRIADLKAPTRKRQPRHS